MKKEDDRPATVETTPEGLRNMKLAISVSVIFIIAMAYYLRLSAEELEEPADDSGIVFMALASVALVSFLMGVHQSRRARKILNNGVIAIAHFQLITLLAFTGSIISAQSLSFWILLAAGLVSLLGIWLIVPTDKEQ